MNKKKSHLDPFLNKHRGEVSNQDFPEIEGMAFVFDPGHGSADNGKRPSILIQDEIGLLPQKENQEFQWNLQGDQHPLTPKESYKFIELDLSKAVEDIPGGEPSPTILSAGDFYDQLLEQPRVVQAEVLIKKDRIYTIRRVSPGKVEEKFIAGSDLTDFQKEIVLDKILGEYRSQGDEVAVAIEKKAEPMFNTGSLMNQMKRSMDQQQIDAYKKLQEDQEKALMFGSKVHDNMQGNDDVVTSLGLAMMQTRGMGIQLENPLSKPIIDFPGT